MNAISQPIKSSRCTMPLPSDHLESVRVQLTNPVDQRKLKVTFTIVKDEPYVNLIESRTVQQMQLITVRNDEIKSPCPKTADHASKANLNAASTQTFKGINLEQICSEFEDVFEGLGDLGNPLQLLVDKDVRPVQQQGRTVPEVMRKPLKEYLDDLEAKGVIEKLERPTEWVNSVMIAREADGKLRLFLDPKSLKRCH